jgi:biopolymer transport protein ExbB/TolQ
VYTVVPPADRLTVGDVFANAAPEMQLAMALLIAGTLAAAVVWGMSLGKVGKADAKGLAAALGRLRIVRSAGVPLGCLAAAYVMFSSFLAIANVRPTPTLSVVAPGLAEAALAIMLGLLATTVAVVCERHLEGRIRRAAA